MVEPIRPPAESLAKATVRQQRRVFFYSHTEPNEVN